MRIKKELYNSAAIRAAMAAKQKTVEQLGRETKLGRPTITKVRAGRNVKISTLKTVCESLGITISIGEAA